LPATAVDILEISDCRFPGQVSRSLAAEIGVQDQLGSTTAIAHVNGPLVARLNPFHAELADHIRAGRAQLIVGTDPAIARVTIVRHPALLQEDHRLPAVRTERVILVASVPPVREDGRQIYDPALVEAAAHTHFGISPVWAPTSGEIREQIRLRLPEAETTDDWFHPGRAPPCATGPLG
jgi:hypothetical protein